MTSDTGYKTIKLYMTSDTGYKTIKLYITSDTGRSKDINYDYGMINTEANEQRFTYSTEEG